MNCVDELAVLTREDEKMCFQNLVHLILHYFTKPLSPEDDAICESTPRQVSCYDGHPRDVEEGRVGGAGDQ